jgi:phage terminase large subunit
MNPEPDFDFDYKNPDYRGVYAQRLEQAKKLEDPELVKALKVHYATHPWDFINDWGVTFEPRNVERGLMTNIPFILWEKQVEYLQWLYGRWRAGERGLVEKARDCGVTWLTVGFAVNMWCNVDGFVTGLTSREADLVDKKGSEKSLFEKVRFFIDNLPREFWPDTYLPRIHSTKMLIKNPDTDAAIVGEAGDEIGRGGRTSMTVVDESAFVQHQDAVAAALSQNTNCHVDVSTVNGNGNLFYRNAMKFDNTPRKFVFDWTDDPRKDKAWLAKQYEEYDEATVAREVLRDYEASQSDSFIPAKWIRKCVDAHLTLGFIPSGARTAGFDPADVGDAKAIVCCHGPLVTQAKQLKHGDITTALPWAFEVAEENRTNTMGFDADGMGAPVMKVYLTQAASGDMRIVAYHGSSGVIDKHMHPRTKARLHKDRQQGKLSMEDDITKTNADTYGNFRSQSWTWLREAIELTYLCVTAKEDGAFIMNVDSADLISFDSNMEELQQLTAELSRPRRLHNASGKILVESKPQMKSRGVESPNLGDGCVMARAMFRMKAPNRIDPYEEDLRFESYGPSVDGVM